MVGGDQGAGPGTEKVVLISEDNREPFPEDAELKAGIIEYLVPEHFREPKEEEQQMDQIRLIMDSEYILTGTVTGKSSDTCLYSGQKNLSESSRMPCATRSPSFG